MNTISECMNFGVRYADAVWLENYEAIQTIKYTYEGGKSGLTGSCERWKS